eukprot:m.296386 g.296386  ORF g.296386 m.296386 type:complete len:303 (+) comp13380_c0_seq1:67-975(+)
MCVEGGEGMRQSNTLHKNNDGDNNLTNKQRGVHTSLHRLQAVQRLARLQGWQGRSRCLVELPMIVSVSFPSVFLCQIHIRLRIALLTLQILAVNQALNALLQIGGLDRKLELLKQLGDKHVVLETLAGLHDAHNSSVNRASAILEHLFLCCTLLLGRFFLLNRRDPNALARVGKLGVDAKLVRVADVFALGSLGQDAGFTARKRLQRQLEHNGLHFGDFSNLGACEGVVLVEEEQNGCLVLAHNEVLVTHPKAAEEDTLAQRRLPSQLAAGVLGRVEFGKHAQRTVKLRRVANGRARLRRPI